MFLFEVAAADK